MEAVGTWKPTLAVNRSSSWSPVTQLDPSGESARIPQGEGVNTLGLGVLSGWDRPSHTRVGMSCLVGINEAW